MSAPLGFILLTHSDSPQSVRLVNRLNAMFDFPPITWHHDFSKGKPPEAKFSPNITFVRRPVRAERAEYSLVEAELRAMEQMFSQPGAPERFVLLSGQDYPIKPAKQILADLQAGGFDAHMHYDLVREDQQATKELRMLYERHLCYNFPPLPLFRWLDRNWPMFIVKYRGPFRGLVPFSREFECYAGSQWFVANRRTVEHILEFHRTRRKLARYYRWRLFPDEVYLQTIVVNEPRLKTNRNNWRYVDWSSGTSHPKILGLEDLPKLMASPAHFARKFSLQADAKILDRLDEVTA